MSGKDDRFYTAPNLHQCYLHSPSVTHALYTIPLHVSATEDSISNSMDSPFG